MSVRAVQIFLDFSSSFLHDVNESSWQWVGNKELGQLGSIWAPFRMIFFCFSLFFLFLSYMISGRAVGNGDGGNKEREQLGGIWAELKYLH